MDIRAQHTIATCSIDTAAVVMLDDAAHECDAY